MKFTLTIKNEQIGPASIEAIQSHLNGRRLTGDEPVVCHTSNDNQHGQARSFDELQRFIGPADHDEKLAEDRPYVANHLSLKARLFCSASILVSGFMLYDHLVTGRTIVWASRRGPSLEVAGWWGLPAFLIFSGLLSASFAMILDHFDRRPNERFYKRWLVISLITMLTGKLSALIAFHYLRK